MRDTVQANPDQAQAIDHGYNGDAWITVMTASGTATGDVSCTAQVE